MKKLLSLIISCTLLCGAAAISACTPETDEGSVTLFSVSGGDVGTAEADYFVAAEPLATTRATALGMHFVGSLQELYGDGSGYPQAVVVAKNSLVESAPLFINQFVSALEGSASWLESATAQQIASAVNSHLPAGQTPTFTAEKLSAQVVKNCGVGFVAAKADEQRYRGYIQKLGGVDPDAVGQISESFFYAPSQAQTNSYSGSVSVFAPDGAPALGLASLMSESAAICDIPVSYGVVAADTIATKISGQNPEADICVLPSNLAAKKLANAQSYTMLGTLTNGNLFILSKSEGEITKQNLPSLKGKKVGVVNLAAVPGLTFKCILKENSVSYTVNG